ncbi:MAG: formylglycine-generating enzyme family protein [Planctomycetota bacterium]|jgi:sulfatase modifying factor 1
MKICFSRVTLILISLGINVGTTYAGMVTFGTGSNSFDMEFVPIGNPGNTNDTTGDPNPVGSVGYTYDIGKFEVSQDMITKYNAGFGTQNSLVIPFADLSAFGGNGPDKPASGISWNQAARFVNWLNTSTGKAPAYNFITSDVNDDIALWSISDPGYDASNQYRNSLAQYVLPSNNEWYKAAYYDPNKSGGVGYWDYPTGSDTVPTSVASGIIAGTAVYDQPYLQGPANVNQAGGLSPFGVMGLGGNVNEWEETSDDLANASGSSQRGVRGGAWFDGFSSSLSSSTRISEYPNNDCQCYGFRVVSLTSSPASVPEPDMMVIATLLGLGGYISKRGLRRRACAPFHW